MPVSGTVLHRGCSTVSLCDCESEKEAWPGPASVIWSTTSMPLSAVGRRAQCPLRIRDPALTLGGCDHRGVRRVECWPRTGEPSESESAFEGPGDSEAPLASAAAQLQVDALALAGGSHWPEKSALPVARMARACVFLSLAGAPARGRASSGPIIGFKAHSTRLGRCPEGSSVGFDAKPAEGRRWPRCTPGPPRPAGAEAREAR